MLQQISIGKRLFAGFGILLAFVIIVAAAGQWGLTTSVDTASNVMNVDVAVAAASNDAHIATVDMRRFEKDYYLNIGNAEKEAEYLAKWEKSRRTFDENLTALERLVKDDKQQDLIRSTRTDVNMYVTTFQSIAKRIIAGEIKTGPDANKEMAAAKDEIHRVEDSVQTFDDASAQNVQDKKKAILAVEKNARTIMMIVTGLALFVAFVIAVGITRSITSPIATVVAIAEKL